MPSNRPIDPVRIRAEVAAWPKRWANEEDDVAEGERIVAQLQPFIEHLLASGLSPSTQRRHIDNLGWLGRTLIDQRQEDDKPKPVPPLAEVVEDEGGPLLHRASEAQQRSYDATCKALYRFLTRADLTKPVIAPRRRSGPRPDRLDALIAEATTDAYGDYEELDGFLVCLQERVRLPFTTEVLGDPVEVIGFDVGPAGGLVAICRRGRHRQRLLVVDLPLPEPPVADHDWIRAYVRWLQGAGR